MILVYGLFIQSAEFWERSKLVATVTLICQNKSRCGKIHLLEAAFIPVSFHWNFVSLLWIGTAPSGHFISSNADLSLPKLPQKSDQVFPYFIVEPIARWIDGLYWVLRGSFAAGMSTVSTVSKNIQRRIPRRSFQKIHSSQSFRNSFPTCLRGYPLYTW